MGCEAWRFGSVSGGARDQASHPSVGGSIVTARPFRFSRLRVDEPMDWCDSPTPRQYPVQGLGQRHGRVPKWPKGTDCKSVIRGFKSHRDLFKPRRQAGFFVGRAGIELASLARLPASSTGKTKRPAVRRDAGCSFRRGLPSCSHHALTGRSADAVDRLACVAGCCRVSCQAIRILERAAVRSARRAGCDRPGQIRILERAAARSAHRADCDHPGWSRIPAHAAEQWVDLARCGPECCRIPVAWVRGSARPARCDPAWSRILVDAALQGVGPARSWRASSRILAAWVP